MPSFRCQRWQVVWCLLCVDHVPRDGGLLLSLTFTEVVGELSVTENVIAREAVTIQDAHHNLRRFGQEETRDIQVLLCDYTQAVIDDDWPALAAHHGR